MRYYNIQLSQPNGTPVYLKSLQGNPLTSLTAGGQFNPGALQIELNIPLYPHSTGDAAHSYVEIWGIGLADLTHQADFNNLNISVYGGMSAGLPLANPQQAGLLVQGTIFQCFGNWLGTKQSLTFVIGPAVGTPGTPPANAPFAWQAGTPLSAALRNLFDIAFPNLESVISISPKLVLNYTETGYYQGLKPFSQWLLQRTQGFTGPDYSGVYIAISGTKILAFDNSTTPATTTQINPQDLVGQPTWLSLNTMNFKTVMRADIKLGAVVQLPPTIIQQNPASQAQYRNQMTFNGMVKIIAAQHFGNFRQPSADSWVTSFQAAVPPVSSN